MKRRRWWHRWEVTAWHPDGGIDVRLYFRSAALAELHLRMWETLSALHEEPPPTLVYLRGGQR
jgi:hypothetical protein